MMNYASVRMAREGRRGQSLLRTKKLEPQLPLTQKFGFGSSWMTASAGRKVVVCPAMTMCLHIPASATILVWTVALIRHAGLPVVLYIDIYIEHYIYAHTIEHYTLYK